MPKKRHKPNLHHNQKVANAQYRNDFFKRLANFCLSITGENVVKLIPPYNQDLIYYAHSRPISAEAEEGHDIPPHILDAVKVIVNSQLKHITVTIEKTNKQVPLSEYYALGLSLYVHFITIDNLPYKNSEKVKALLEDNCGRLDFIFDILYDKLHDDIFPYLILITNHLCLHYFSYRLDTGVTNDNTKLGAKFKIIVKKYPSETIPVTIDNNTRKAYRIGWTFKADDFEWIYVTPLQLGINSAFDNLQIPVYIQMHALRRLMERIDCIHPAYLLSGIYSSLRECIVLSDKNKFIIEFKVLHVKVGYLSALMIDGQLVIRTFLFLTFNGTPEGKRLEDFIGLKKLDTKYLKMDRLSSFMSGKLSSNEELRSIFDKADCLHLVELYDKLDKFSMVHRESSPIEMLTSYLKTNEIKLDDWAFDEVNE
jgi:hypothetical protein